MSTKHPRTQLARFADGRVVEYDAAWERRRKQAKGVFGGKGGRDALFNEGIDDHGMMQSHSNRVAFNLGDGARWKGHGKLFH